MRFWLVDRIVEFVPAERIVAVKAVSASEEYLADHFPTFAVLPGVFMLEAMAEAAAWLVRAAQDFAPNLILLQGAKNITYKSFVRPGHILEVTVECRRLTPNESEFSGVGRCEGREVVKGRFTLCHWALDPGLRERTNVQQEMVRALKSRFEALRQGSANDMMTGAGSGG